MRRAPSRLRGLWTVVAGSAPPLVAVVNVILYLEFYRSQTDRVFASDEDYFLFGSTGNEREHGIPYWIWLVLPRIFPEHLPRPGGYAALGFASRQGEEMPVIPPNLYTNTPDLDFIIDRPPDGAPDRVNVQAQLR